MNNMMKQKRGISDIIATVLIIFLSVALVIMISAFVFSFLRNMTLGVEQETFSIDSACYEPSSNLLSVYISRNTEESSEYNFTGLEIIYYDEFGSSSWKNRRVPGRGEKRGFVVLFVENLPERIEVLPIITKDGRERKGSITSTFQDIEVSDSCLKSYQDSALFENVENSLGLTTPGVPGDPPGV